MSYTNYPNGLTSFGIPVLGGGVGSIFGKTIFVDPNNGDDGNSGLEVEKALKTLTQAFVIVKDYDTILCAPGDYSGNYTTPLNAVASFVTLIGVQGPDMGVAPWAAPTNVALPIITVKARGWRISGFEFEGMTGAAAIRFKKIIGLTERCDFFQVDHCVFSGGKTGIEFYGGGTYWKINDNHFSLLSTAGGAAIFVADSSYQVPALGLIENNRFAENINDIDANAKGLNGIVIRGNVFQQDSGTDAVIIIDLIGSGCGGSLVVDNYIDIAKGEFNTGGTQRIFSNSTDAGMGNHFNDGEQAATMRQ